MKCLVVIQVAIAGAVVASIGGYAQTATLEYQVKAAYLLNFLRYVEWPEDVLGDGLVTLCVAGRNPFGTTLDETVRGEQVGRHAIAVRVILEPEPGCHAIFVPRGAATQAYLRATRGEPVLTIGEGPEFIEQGGIISFLLDGSNVRFAIDQAEAERSGLRISSRLLRLARTADTTATP